MKLIILSGLSGSGKTVALHTLEDAGYYCIDNLPVGMLTELVDHMVKSPPAIYDMVAIAIDSRSGIDRSAKFDEIIARIKQHPLQLEILYLTSDVSRLVKRFSETRRKHPLSRQGLSLVEAISKEKELLENICAVADLSIDSSSLNVHELRQMIISRLLPEAKAEMAILIQSFGFKYGIPTDTDFVFDVRCLPNPHWEDHLKSKSGRDAEVVEYLEGFPEVGEMLNSIYQFLHTWMPRFELENRSYMTVSIGCTGGQHRSVYLVEKLTRSLLRDRSNISSRHRELT
ncbi:MAG: UPF0042 nucleotide-binding protein [Planctomycetota bacterium]|jgi:UPF0042 nucleotide-binding protein